jgi:hypothetical protein
MNALQIINSIQKELRLPMSVVIDEPHAQLLLGFINKVQRSLMLESVVWDELKRYTSFQTSIGVPTYNVSAPGGEDVDIIRSLQIGSNAPLVKLTDEEFRQQKRLTLGNGLPMFYRHFARNGGIIVVELLPVPDASYQVDASILIKPPMLVNSTDVPLLDPDTIILGAITLARKEQGEDFGLEQAVFQAKLSMQTDTQGESNWGDMVAV